MPTWIKVDLIGVGPYSQSRRLEFSDDEKKNKTFWDLEQEHWRRRLHVNKEGNVFIPAVQFNSAIIRAAALLKILVPGQSKGEYGKYFESGVRCMEGIVLDLKPEDVEFEDLFLSKNGRKGGMDVLKRMPVIHRWEGTTYYLENSDKVPKDIFIKHLEYSGRCVGIGRYRPEKRGGYGMFEAKNIEWGVKSPL